MQIWREEVFGPVLSVKTFSTEEEAIDLANDTQWVDELIIISLLNHFFLDLWIDIKVTNLIFHSYGLGSAVMSNDSERCERLSKVRLIQYIFI